MTNYWPTYPDIWPFRAVYAALLSPTQLRLSWELHTDLKDAPAWRTYVQLNYHEEQPDQWQTIVGPLHDTIYADITVPRPRGKVLGPYVRIKLETGNNTYYSKPRTLAAITSRKLGIYSQAVIRRMSLQRTWMPRTRGWLLKRRTVGQACTCTDPLTGMSTTATCMTCLGTGIVGGYWQAIKSSMLLLGEQQRDDQWQAGQMVVARRSGLILGIPTAIQGDIWVDEPRNDRYVIQKSDPIELYGIPVACNVALEMIQHSDIIYQFQIND